MTVFINTLETEFEKIAIPKIAAQQKAYMRNQFEYYGIKSPNRKAVQRPFLTKEFLPAKVELRAIVKELWDKPQREYQYFSQELVFKYSKRLSVDDIELLEFMITHKSWWDTVDFIAVNLVGNYFKLFPEQIDNYVQKWLDSGNMWLQRTAIIFQLKYKGALDTALLTMVINRMLGSKEFFINKAIGWVLREYGKTNPDWVIDFASKTDLHSLSDREALRIIKKG